MVIDAVERDPYFDNAKLMLIVLVVLGHAIEPLIHRSVSLRALYLTIYSFHMPAFVLISGYFARRSNKAGWSALERLLIPYVIFQVLYSVFDHYAFRTSRLTISFFTPYWIMWFLLSLACWHWVTPYITRLRHPILLTVSLAVLASCFKQVGSYVSISRTVTFLPFFLVGYCLGKQQFEVLARPGARLVSVVVLGAIALLNYKLSVESLYGSFPYAESTHLVWAAGAQRLLLFAIQALATTAALSLVPRRRSAFTAMGSRTLCAYLLHGFVVKYALARGVYGLINSPAQEVLLLGASLLTSLALSTHAISVLAKPLVEPWRFWPAKTPVS